MKYFWVKYKGVWQVAMKYDEKFYHLFRENLIDKRDLQVGKEIIREKCPRSDGHYRVSYLGKNRIAYYHHDSENWSMIGTTESFTDTDFSYIDEEEVNA